MDDDEADQLELTDPDGVPTLRVYPAGSRPVTRFATATEPTRLYAPHPDAILTIEIGDHDQPSEALEVLLDLDADDLTQLISYLLANSGERVKSRVRHLVSELVA
jgi:hypothetical protein